MQRESLTELARSRLQGFNIHCGIRLDLVEEGFCRGNCQIDERHVNPLGMAHGGLICTLMDVCSGNAAFYARSREGRMVTQGCDIHYLRPVPMGVMSCEARVVRAGARVCVVRAEVFDREGNLAADGTFTFFYLD